MDTDRVLAIADRLDQLIGSQDLTEASAAALRALVAERQAVLDLHSPFSDDFCIECRHAWPCPTVRALGVTDD